MKRDFHLADTTYGQTLEDISISFNFRAEVIVHGNATINGSAVLRPINRKRMQISIANHGGVDVYVGSAGVTGTDGYPIPEGETRKFNTTSAISVYSAAPADVRFIEELLGPDA